MSFQMHGPRQGLEVAHVGARAGGFSLNDVSFSVAEGEILAVVGPSGCGKSTLLHALAGLKRSSGTVSIGGDVVSSLPAEKRPTGLVFQSPVLFPGLTVRENIGYGLDDVRMRHRKREDLLDMAMSTMSIDELAEESPSTLSGGQSQRVALAQALVRRPRVLLLDEPLSHVEGPLRRGIRRDLRTQVGRSRMAAVYVTHDLDDAFLVADRIAVMRKGELVQVGEPKEIYRRPSSRFVAELMGQENILSVMVLSRPVRGLAHVVLGRKEYEIPCDPSVRPGPAVAVLPGESIELEVAGTNEEVVGCVGQVLSAAFVGSREQIEVETEVGTLIVHETDPEASRKAGERVRFLVRPGRGWILQA